MTTHRTEQTPLLFDGNPVTELLVPVRTGTAHERGIDQATALAERWGVPVRLVHVRTPDEPAPTAETDDVIDATDRLRAAHPNVMADGVEIEHEDIATGIESTKVFGSLVMVASDHVSAWTTPESVGEQIVRSAETAVLLTGPRCEAIPTEGVIVVPLDGSVRAEAAIDPALALGAAAGTSIRFVTVVPSATSEQVAELAGRGERVSESGYLRSVVDDLEGRAAEVGWDIVHGDDPTASLVEFVAGRDVAMVVAGAHGASPRMHRILGSTSLGLVQRLDVPVMIVKGPVDSELQG